MGPVDHLLYYWRKECIIVEKKILINWVLRECFFWEFNLQLTYIKFLEF